MLPGHAYCLSASIAPAVKGTGFQPFCALTWRAKCSTSAGRSSRALAQRRQFDGKDDDAMIEIAPEAARLDQLLEIAMRGHHHAHVHGGGLVRADALHLALFKHAQQLGLHGERHVANLIEKERAAMRLLELARVPLRRAGEGALLVAEKLALNQLGGNGRAVERDERPRGAVALLVQRARHQLLARAGFAVDADARFARGHALNLRHHAAHGFAGKDQRVLAHAGAQILILGFQAGELERVLDRDQQLLGGERLLEKVQRAQPRCRTAISMCAWPLIITTGAATPAVFRSSSRASPSRRGITTSLKIRSKGCVRASSSARAALSQTTASWPASRKARESEASVLASSSTMRIFALAVMVWTELLAVSS